MKVKGFIIHHKLTVSILIFLAIFFLLHHIKPGLMYDNDGSFRQFGVGYKHKTVIPIWLVSILLSILTYTFVLYVIEMI
jgi:hypothetical protein